jgi:hypothetical protein
LSPPYALNETPLGTQALAPQRQYPELDTPSQNIEQELGTVRETQMSPSQTRIRAKANKPKRSSPRVSQSNVKRAKTSSSLSTNQTTSSDSSAPVTFSQERTPTPDIERPTALLKKRTKQQKDGDKFAHENQLLQRLKNDPPNDEECLEHMDFLDNLPGMTYFLLILKISLNDY